VDRVRRPERVDERGSQEPPGQEGSIENPSTLILEYNEPSTFFSEILTFPQLFGLIDLFEMSEES
jgi:hypothetical protein